MKTDLDFRNNNLMGSVVFRPQFNNFEQINATQAWSLFFTGSREDKALGFQPTAGKFFNNVLLALISGGMLWAICFT
jgi:hypothetical protein